MAQPDKKYLCRIVLTSRVVRKWVCVSINKSNFLPCNGDLIKFFKKINQKNIFFIGDALFSFPPSFAQGASQSIETSHDLFEYLKNNEDMLYKDRINKIHSVNLRSKLNHFAFHLSNPLNIFFRNIFF